MLVAAWPSNHFPKFMPLGSYAFCQKQPGRSYAAETRFVLHGYNYYCERSVLAKYRCINQSGWQAG